jgi:isopentenyl diphosphate isomerase/L-lactate dehydrogenase-like FMN-dependent dehydrogenase
MDDVRQRFQNLHEFVTAAREKLNRNYWDYLVGGSETETTVRRNRLALDSIAFRPRVLRDVSKTDCSGTFLGRKLKLPICLAPVGSIERFSPGGCAEVADATGRFGVGMYQSSVAKPEVEETAKHGPGGLKIFQLYVRGDHAWVEAFLDRAVNASFDALCLTVDTHHYSRRERDIAKRFRAASARSVEQSAYQMQLDWAQMEKIRKRYKLPLIAKGVATAEDAKLCVEHGIDVVHVSNHGGRQLDHGVSAIDTLPEIVAEVKGRAQIIIDGGFMRGTDIVKAIAMGANAVCIGRLYCFGMAAAGRDGIVRVLEILQDEMECCLSLLGVNRLDELNPSYLRAVQPTNPVHVLSAFPFIDPPDNRY